MTKDEEIRINAALAEMTNALIRATHRSVDLASEVESLKAKLAEEKAKSEPAQTPLEVVK